MYGAGADRNDLRPLDFEGNRELDLEQALDEGEVQSLGCHVGRFMGLNVLNPQPGWHYMWANDNPRDRLMVSQRGGTIVQADDPEMAAYNRMIGHDATPLDTAHAGYPGVILVKTPIEVERARKAEEQHKRDSLLRGGDNYLEEGRRNADEMDAGHRHGGLRYSRMDHRFKATAGPDEADRTLDVWSPDAGIVR